MSEKLYQAMGDISEKHILEAEQFSAATQNGSATSGAGPACPFSAVAKDKSL